MKQFRRFLTRIGIDGAIVAILGIVAIAAAIYDLIGGNQVNPSVLVAVLALLLLEVVLQRRRIENSKDDIINSLKGLRIEVYSNGKDFEDAKYRQLLMTEKSLYDMELCPPKLPAPDPQIPRTERAHRKLLNERVTKGEITFKYVQVIYDRPQFESVLRKLFQFYKYKYYIGYFVGAPEVVPVLNLMIYDDVHFFIGGYYGPTVRGDDRNIYIQHDLIGQTLQQYFDYLWSKARLLNENQAIKWDEVRHCGLALGYTVDELNTIIAQIAHEVGLSQPRVLQ